MNVRNVVKIMNFHSLLRVDKAKKTANKYQLMEEQLLDMIDTIINNRNLILDKKVLKINENGPELNLYLGSDYGFCSNFNSRINDRLRTDGGEQILIGRKLHGGSNVIYRTECEAFRENMAPVQKIVVDGMNERRYSRINIIYNHYVNTADIQFRVKQVYPVEFEKRRKHNDDFVVEGDLNQLLADLIISYVNYEIMLADVFSSAAENLMRQNATRESLNRLDELEEEQLILRRRQEREKEFAKVIDNFAKMKNNRDHRVK
jgi:F0F1-type ATP synthase gamma subunit